MAAISDHDILGDKVFVAHEEFVRERDASMDELSAEELLTERKLLKKIDTIIMPLVILVYLMNYIDRYGVVMPWDMRMMKLSFSETTMRPHDSPG